MKRILLLMLAVFFCRLPCADAFAVSSGEQAVNAKMWKLLADSMAMREPEKMKIAITGDSMADGNVQNPESGLTAAASGSWATAAAADEQTARVSGNATPGAVSFAPAGVTGGGNFSASTTATFKVNLTVNGAPYSGQKVTWSIISADNSPNAAVVSSHQNKATGLAWGRSAAGSPGAELTSAATSGTDSSGNADIQLTDIMGERTARVQARTIVGGTPYTVTQSVAFGKGPLAKFRLPSGGSVGVGDWDTAYAACNGVPYTGRHIAGWMGGAYRDDGKMPTRFELLAVSAGRACGAYRAAGWPAFSGFWTGEAHSGQFAFFVLPASGAVGHDPVIVNSRSFVCRR